MKKLFLVGIFVVGVGIFCELCSAYILYRHYASAEHPFYPAGTATHALFARILSRTTGRKEHVRLTIDHTPLYIPDATFGYAMHAGRFRVTERLNNQLHLFHLTIDEKGRRVTSYAPFYASRHIYITGDSAMIGWGLDDEQTMPWLLQARLPNYEVVNMSVTSYSTIDALLQLRALVPQVGADDIVVLVYHDITNSLNVAAPEIVNDLATGYEFQLGDVQAMSDIAIPFGAIDANGGFSIRRFPLYCLKRSSDANCVHPKLESDAAWQVTERAFDEIIGMHVGRLVVMFTSGTDADPVIKHLREKGVTIADLRTIRGAPDADDIIPSDSHAGPFANHRLFSGLLDALQRDELIK